MAKKNIDYWNIKINARSFVYRQVRRIVGTLIAIGKNRINEQNIYEMLTIPSQYSLCKGISVVPAYGLYLANIEFEHTQAETSNISFSSFDDLSD